jgi:hypothetical protein
LKLHQHDKTPATLDRHNPQLEQWAKGYTASIKHQQRQQNIRAGILAAVLLCILACILYACS